MKGQPMRLLSVPVTLPTDPVGADRLIEPRERRVRHAPLPASATPYSCDVCESALASPDAHAEPDIEAMWAAAFPAPRPLVVVLAEAFGVDLLVSYLSDRLTSLRKAHA